MIAMALPPWTPAGLLPPGVHTASMSELYDRMVLDAPHRERRETLFAALRTYLGLVERFVGHGTAWIDGGFTMQKEDPPHDVDVAARPADWSELETLGDQERVDLLGLLTLQDIIMSRPDVMWLERVQPIGGALDAFLVRPEGDQAWFDTWSSVKRGGILQEGEIKGFVEVAW